jgi:hypothetical protein
MAALSGITAVRPTANTRVSDPVIYGETISAGQSVYQDSTDGKWKLADGNLSAAAAAAKGIAITPGVLDGYGLVALDGGIILVGTTMAIGETYYVGATAGAINPDADLTTGWFVTRLGTASSATQLNLSVLATGITHP